jgi:beta-lactamase class A
VEEEVVPEGVRREPALRFMTLHSELRFLCCAVLLVGIAQSVPGATAAGRDSTFRSEVRRLERTYGGHLGLMAKNLRTGETVSYNPSERFPTASLIKLPVMAAAFHEAELGRIRLDERITLTVGDKKPGSGILQSLSDGTSVTLLDAVKLMIDLSDNTATNLVLDRMGSSHDERLETVNAFLRSRGLNNTRILNRLYSLETKKNTPEAIRYGIGVATPEDIVRLLEGLYSRSLVDTASCATMIEILKAQWYADMIPRFLPSWECTTLEVAHKTGGIAETKVDAGIVYSDRADIAMAIFVDKHPDHQESTENRATTLVALTARAIWNHFTGMDGYTDRRVRTAHVDWNSVAGGMWGIYRSPASPFPHRDRREGWTASDGTVYPAFPHYLDSSVVVFVPKGFRELPSGSNLIVHFHGHANDNLGVLEQDSIPQAVIARKINALLVLVQGPYRARDSFSGRMEEEGGLKRLVDDVLAAMQREKVVQSARPGRILISAFSGGFRPGAFVLEKGGLSDRVSTVFLFDALYAHGKYFLHWLLGGRGEIYGAYTDHLEKEYLDLLSAAGPANSARVHFTKATVTHDDVVRTYINDWLSKLGPEWKTNE